MFLIRQEKQYEPKFTLPCPLYNNAGTFFDYLFLVFLEMFPEWILAALIWSGWIDGTSFLGALEKDTFKTMFRRTFLDGKPVFDTVEIFPGKINGIYLQ